MLNIIYIIKIITTILIIIKNIEYENVIKDLVIIYLKFIIRAFVG